MSVEFGDILKQTLEERGINQKWLADAADTKEATISRYINGVNKSARLDILVSIDCLFFALMHLASKKCRLHLKEVQSRLANHTPIRKSS